MVYGYTKTTKVYKIYLQNNTKTTKVYKIYLQNNFNSQIGASIKMVYRYTKTTECTRSNFRKLHISILTYKKGLPYLWYTGIQRLQSIQNLFGKLKNQF